MALPRYKTNIPYQPSTVAGLQESARTFGSLAERLEQFANIGYEIGKEDATERGYQKALTDMTSGEPPKVEEGYGFYAKAYNKTAQTAYNSQVEADLKFKAEEFSIKAQSKEEFDAMFQSYAKTTVSKIEQPEFKAIYQQNALKLGSTYSSKLVSKLYERDRKNQIDSISLALEDDKTSYSSAMANGDEASATDALAKATARMESLVQLKEMSPEAIPYKLKEFVKGARIISTQTAFINAEQSGQGTEFVKEFLNRKDIEPKERLEQLKFFKNYTNERHDAVYAEMKNAQDTVDAYSKIKTREILAKTARGEDVPQSTLDAMLNDGLMKLPDYKFATETKANMKAGAFVSDENVYLSYLSKLETTPKETIINDNRLSAKDKETLMKRQDEVSVLGMQNKEVREQFQAFKNVNGKDPWALAQDKINKGMKDTFVPNEFAKDRAEAMDAIRAKVATGELLPTQVADEADKQLELFTKRNADKKAKREQDMKDKKYEEELKKYNEKKSSMFGKFQQVIGIEIEQPKR